MLDKRTFCRDISLGSGEQLPGTAGLRRAWLLLQDHSAWAVKAYAGSDLPLAVRAHLERYFGAEKPDILLIRNSDARHPSPRTAFVAVSRGERNALYEFRWSRPEDLLSIPYAAILDGSYEGAEAAPIYLVCTHGKRDKCCALHGMPVYEYLRKQLGERVWRASHVGGDRFAANLVCLPHGLYYGRVTPEQALDLVRRYARGELAPEQMRGRSCYAKPVQAAEIHIRRHWDLCRIDRLRFHSHQMPDETLHRVAFIDTETGSLLQLELQQEQSDFVNFLTCRADETETVPIYRPVRYTATPAVAEPHVLST